MGKVIRISVYINICPQVVVFPCPEAIYMYKSIKIYSRTRCQVSVYTAGPLVLWFIESSSKLLVTRTGIKALSTSILG